MSVVGVSLKKKVRQILSRLVDGKIDLLISTHRLLSRYVSYPYLGLLIVDDEQRFCFFFQAEDGIRDLTVTGVQTCALPISRDRRSQPGRPARSRRPTAR